MYSITEEGEKFLEENIDNDAFTQRMEQFQNIDFERKLLVNNYMKYFKGFMKASQRALQDEEMKKEFDQFVEETKNV